MGRILGFLGLGLGGEGRQISSFEGSPVNKMNYKAPRAKQKNPVLKKKKKKTNKPNQKKKKNPPS